MPRGAKSEKGDYLSKRKKGGGTDGGVSTSADLA